MKHRVIIVFMTVCNSGPEDVTLCDDEQPGDIKLALSHFKYPGSTEQQGGILGTLNAHIWVLSSSKQSYFNIGDATLVNNNGSKLTLSFDRKSFDNNAQLLLSKINSETPVKFGAAYNASGTLLC